MKTRRTKFNGVLLRSTSAFLAFLLSSVLVLACCGFDLFEAKTASFTFEDEESCPIQKGHECCEKKKDAKNISESENDNADCCIFKPTRTLSADLQNLKITKHTAAVAQKQEASKPVYFIKQTYKTPKIYHSAIRNRGSTYLQNCVFRI